MSVSATTETRPLSQVTTQATSAVTKAAEKKGSCCDRVATWIIERQNGSVIQKIYTFVLCTIAFIVLAGSIIGVPVLMCAIDSYLKRKKEMAVDDAVGEVKKVHLVEVKEKDDEIKKVTEALVEKSADNDKLHNIVRRTAKEHAEEKTANLQAIRSLREDLATQKEMNEKHQSAVQDYKDQIVFISGKRTEVEKRIEVLEKQIQDLGLEVEGANAKVRASQNEIEKSKSELGKAREERDGAIKGDPKLSDTLKQREAEIAELRSALDSLSTQKAQVEEALKAAKAAKSDSAGLSSSATEPVAGRRTKGVSFGTEGKRSGLPVSEDSSGELAKLRSENSSLRSQADSSSSEAAALKDKLASLERQLSEVRGQLAEKTSALSAASSKSGSGDSPTKLKAAEERLTKLQGEYDALNKNHTGLKNRAQQLSKELDAANEELTKLKSAAKAPALSSSSVKPEKKDDDEAAKLRSENARLVNQLRDAKSAATEATRLKGDADKARITAEKEAAKLKDAAAEGVRLKKIEEEVTKLKDSLKAKEQELAQANLAVADAERDRETAEKESGQLRTANGAKAQEIGQLKAQVTQLQSEVADLKTQLEAAKKPAEPKKEEKKDDEKKD